MPDTLRLAPIFSDHMVLCRKQPIRVFGEAVSGRTISISIHHHTATVVAVKGHFEALLPPMEHGGPYTLHVTDGELTITFSDVMIGDVYFAGGQSNMEMRLKDTKDGIQYANDADMPLIRYCTYPVQAVLDASTLAWERKTKWHVVQPNACGTMSAVAFHFARKLQNQFNIPIGIIGCYLGGTSITAWLDEETLTATTVGKAYFDAYMKRIQGQTDEEYQKAYSAQQKAFARWNRSANALKRETPSICFAELESALGPCPYPPPEGRKSLFRPCGLAETMVKRIAPYTLTGILYYQGESDYRHPHLYGMFFTALIALWRDLFRSPALPFLFVQLPMYNQRDAEGSWPVLRLAQDAVHKSVRNTGMAVMIDGGEQEDIHPQDKVTVADRLFSQALQLIYHTPAPSHPYAIHARADGNTMLVTVSSPLRDSKTPRLFELAGEDCIFVSADAEINGTEICISSPQVTHPRFVRYAFVNYGEINVYGENKLPLAPFWLRA